MAPEHMEVVGPNGNVELRVVAQVHRCYPRENTCYQEALREPVLMPGERLCWIMGDIRPHILKGD